MAEHGSLSYKPLTSEAQQTGRWALYEDVPTREASLGAAGFTLVFSLLRKARSAGLQLLDQIWRDQSLAKPSFDFGE